MREKEREWGHILPAPNFSCRKIVRKSSCCRKIYVQKCKIGDYKPILVKFKRKINFLAHIISSVEKFAASVEKWQLPATPTTTSPPTECPCHDWTVASSDGTELKWNEINCKLFHCYCCCIVLCCIISPQQKLRTVCYQKWRLQSACEHLRLYA